MVEFWMYIISEDVVKDAAKYVRRILIGYFIIIYVAGIKGLTALIAFISYFPHSFATLKAEKEYQR